MDIRANFYLWLLLCFDFDFSDISSTVILVIPLNPIKCFNYSLASIFGSRSNSAIFRPRIFSNERYVIQSYRDFHALTLTDIKASMRSDYLLIANHKLSTSSKSTQTGHFYSPSFFFFFFFFLGFWCCMFIKLKELKKFETGSKMRRKINTNFDKEEELSPSERDWVKEGKSERSN